jgi:hypothetical protein
MHDRLEMVLMNKSKLICTDKTLEHSDWFDNTRLTQADTFFDPSYGKCIDSPQRSGNSK